MPRRRARHFDFHRMIQTVAQRVPPVLLIVAETAGSVYRRGRRLPVVAIVHQISDQVAAHLLGMVHNAEPSRRVEGIGHFHRDLKREIAVRRVRVDEIDGAVIQLIVDGGIVVRDHQIAVLERGGGVRNVALAVKLPVFGQSVPENPRRFRLFGLYAAADGAALYVQRRAVEKERPLCRFWKPRPIP